MGGVLVAIDGATCSGVAVGEPSSGIPVMILETWRAPKSRPIQEKIEYLVGFLTRLIDKQKILYAGIEIPQAGIGSRKVTVETAQGVEQQTKLGGNARTQSQLWALHGSVVGVLHSRGVPYRGVGVKEWRAAVLGNGNLTGKDAKRVAKDTCARFGIPATNYDTAEAAMLLLYVNNCYRRWILEDQFKGGSAA